jgi:Fe-S oxidoreductase
MTMSDEGLLLNDELWERLLELTAGDTALCYQCGECTAACPWGLVRENGLPVRVILRRAQLGIEHTAPDLWLCTTCGQCQATCPRGVDIPRAFRALRQIAWEQRRVEKGLSSLLWSLYWNDNPWSQPPSQRAAWAGKLQLEAFDPARHEVLLYVGCTSSYNRRAQKIARALVTLLRKAGVSFGYLGDEEPCCGESALSVGNLPYFEELSAHASGVFREKGVKQLITISPHCYDVFKNHYPTSAGFEPRHYTQYLAELVDANKLSFTTSLDLKVTFQDPCYLGRLNQEYAAPRRVLSAIPGIELVEMEDSHQAGLCCGGGGGRMWLETPANERFSDIRVQQVAATGASSVATACPFCLSCLEDSANQAGGGLSVLDVAELAVLALDHDTTGDH